MSKLTAKQRAFIREYVLDLNATQAAIRSGYSEKTAYSQGQRLLKNVEVQKALQLDFNKRAEEVQRTALDVLRDIQDTTKEARGLGDIKAALKGYELEGKYFGMFKDKLEVEASVSVAVSLDSAWQRVSNESE